MNFLQFLSNQPQQQPQSVKQDQPPNNAKAVVVQKINEQDLCRNIRKGTLVRIIRKPKSPHNIYKGYIGEVKEYVKNQDYAIIMLHALNTPKCFRFSLDHFVKLEE